MAHTSSGSSTRNFTGVSRLCLDLNPLGGRKQPFFLFCYVRGPGLLYQVKKWKFYLKPTAVSKLFPLFSLSCTPGKYTNSRGTRELALSLEDVWIPCDGLDCDYYPLELKLDKNNKQI